MSYRKLLLSLTVVAGNNALAGDIYPGYGISYAAKLIFDRKDTRTGAAPASLHSGQTFNTPNDGGKATAIPQTRSMAWCDPVVTPAGHENRGCYGAALAARWFLIDLSRLRGQGLRAVWVTVSVGRAGPKHIIPALTVWRGNQTLGPQLHWFPSELQEQPEFWGWLLRRDPFVRGAVSYNSAYATTSKDLASVTGRFRLRGSVRDFLTVAVGGDANDPNNQHIVDYQLTVDVKRRRPAQ